MNTRLQKMIRAGVIPNRGGVWIDCYNQRINEECAGTIIAGINSKNHYFVTDMNDKVVLGWTRDKRGSVVDRHPVQVANAVTAAKRDNTQNYVVENVGRINNGLSGKVYGVYGICPTICAAEGMKYNTKVAINTDSSGCARTIGCYYKDMDASSVLKKSGTGFGYVRTGIMEYNGESVRIRKLTERECFRLMGVSEEDIDKIQASGVSMSRQYCLAGNSIVVDVLEKIFDKLFIHTEKTSRQLSLF